MALDPATRLAPPPCIGKPPPRMLTPLIRYRTVKRAVWSKAIRRQIPNTTVGYVAVTLANYGDKHGRGCSPGVERLAEDVLCTVRTVVRAMAWLTEYGFVHLHRRGVRKLRQANEYHLAVPAPLATWWPAGLEWWVEGDADRLIAAPLAA